SATTAAAAIAVNAVNAATGGIAAIAARAARVMTSMVGKRSKNHGRSRCTPSVFPPSQDLPVHGSERAEDRLQGFQAADALRLGARQDRAEPHHGSVRQEAARTRARHQARPLPRPVALRDQVNSKGARSGKKGTCFPNRIMLS